MLLEARQAHTGPVMLKLVLLTVTSPLPHCRLKLAGTWIASGVLPAMFDADGSHTTALAVAICKAPPCMALLSVAHSDPVIFTVLGEDDTLSPPPTPPVAWLRFHTDAPLSVSVNAT